MSFRRHLLPLALVLALVALSPRSDEVIEFQSLELQFSALLPPVVSSIVRRPIPVVTVDGVALGESMAQVRARLGEPKRTWSSGFSYGEEVAAGTHISGSRFVERVEGDVLRYGEHVISPGLERRIVLSKLGSPQFRDLSKRRGDGYDAYSSLGPYIGYRKGRVERVWFGALDASDGSFPSCCPLEFWYTNTPFPCQR